GLNNAAALREAYARAHSLSSRILVEKHVSGKDYRLIVLHGKVLAAWERLPGAVIGDGRRSVRELLQELNADPLRRPEAMLRKRIALDNEALELLAEQQLGAEAIPAAGRSVR